MGRRAPQTEDEATRLGQDRAAWPECSFNESAARLGSPPAFAVDDLKWSSTNRRIAEDRLPCWRLLSISPTSSDNVMFRKPAISFMPFQNASSRLTLVLWPPTTIDRFTTGDFMMLFPR